MQYLLLPSVQTPFEVEHLIKTNRIALAFFWLNLPLFVAVAYFNGTGPLLALALTALVMSGPTVAYATLSNQRTVSVIQGVAAMCMGGLLVHFGQGPLQIEMHFYFFSLLAVLSVFGNPMVIVGAAVTVTLHHTVIWAIIPSSVFNYDASIWVVAVHASFVVVESAAAIYIARSFFDNVIGLEVIIEQRTAQLEEANQSMRLVLENVDQGLLTVDREGRLAAERSARVTEWLGETPQSASLRDYLGQVDPQAGEWFEIGWMDLLDGFMPLAVNLSQLPSRVVAGERHLSIAYIPIVGQDSTEEFDQLLVVMSDVTAEIAQAAAEAERQQMLRMLEQFMADRSGFIEFCADAGQLVESLCERSYGDGEVCRRWLHTLKGNAMSFGLGHLGQQIHDLETVLQEEERLPSDAELEGLEQSWQGVTNSLGRLTGDQQRDQLEIPLALYERLEAAAAEGDDPQKILQLVRMIPLESVDRRLSRVADQAHRIAERIGKVEVEIVTEDNGVGLPPEPWAPFWSAFVHVVRNALDHGLEAAEERLEAGKPSKGRLTIQTRIVDEVLSVQLSDDGRGIDWEAIARRAERLGLPHGTHEELVEALFADGLSTREEATAFSGRGVGMAAVRETCRQLGGRVTVRSVEGKGTTFTFTFPLQSTHGMAA